MLVGLGKVQRHQHDQQQIERHADDGGQLRHGGALEEVLPVQRQQIDQHIGGGHDEDEVTVAGQRYGWIIGHQSEADPVGQEKRQNARNQVRDIHDIQSVTVKIAHSRTGFRPFCSNCKTDDRRWFASLHQPFIALM